jgi:P pilus assembly chaperone PapD
MKRTFFNLFALIILTVLANATAFAQAGITASPSRLFFNNTAAGSKSQKIVVTNPSDKPLEIGVSISDWDYDSVGNNRIYDPGKLKTTAAKSINVLPGSYFTLLPNETKELTIQFKPTTMKAAYQTGMIFFTQLNPGTAEKSNGAALKVTVRIGVKVYYSPKGDNDVTRIEIKDLKDIGAGAEKKLQLTLQNGGGSWVNGKCKWEVLNTASGTKTALPEQEFYTLPGDKRILRLPLPGTLPKGKYTATAVLTYGKNKDVKVAELEFEL